MTVVFLQAGVCDLRMWRQQMTAVADAGYQAIAFDRRGDGETTSEDAMLSHVEDLEDLLCELGIGATVPFGQPAR